MLAATHLQRCAIDDDDGLVRGELSRRRESSLRALPIVPLHERTARIVVCLPIAWRQRGHVLPGDDSGADVVEALTRSGKAAPALGVFRRETNGGVERARCLIELAAFPDFLSPFRWRLLAHTSSAYEIRDVDILDRRAQGPASSDDAPWRLSLHVPNHWTPAVHRAAASEVGRVFLGFSRFPAVRTTTHAGVTTVRWDDLRFNPRPRPRPQNDPRGSFFSATVRIDQAGVVIEQTLGP